MPVRAIIILFDVWHTNVMLAEVCDKKPTGIRINYPYLSRVLFTVF